MLISKGNHKLGKDTLILNITAAADCPSRALGLCKLGTKCYAMKAERMYKAVLPYRRAQAKYWEEHTAKEIADDLRREISKTTKYPVRFIRISEAGDFKHQEDVTKLYKIAEVLEDTGVILYCYTARQDLAFPAGPKNLTLNGSGFMLDNCFTAVPKKALPQYQVVCPGNCRSCGLCKAHNKLDIKVGEH